MTQPEHAPLQVGIVGAGLMGQWHGYYARQLGARVVAIADNDPNIGRALADRVPAAQVFGDVASMLAGQRLDALHVCTPLPSHQQIITQAIEAGVHVLAEKPLVATTVETRVLLARAAEQKVMVCPVHQYAFQPGIATLRAATTEWHEPLHCRFTICSAGGAGGGNTTLDAIVADILPHPLSVLRALWPDQDLHASHWTVLRTQPGELLVRGGAGAMTVEMYISMSARPTRSELDVFGRTGRVRINFFHGYAVVERGQVSRHDKIVQPLRYAARSLLAAGGNLVRRAVRREPAYPGLRPLMQAFYSCVTGRMPPPIPPQDVLAVAEIRDRIMAAAGTTITGAVGDEG
jgi:predicted dehydrogenase